MSWNLIVTGTLWHLIGWIMCDSVIEFFKQKDWKLMIASIVFMLVFCVLGLIDYIEWWYL